MRDIDVSKTAVSNLHVPGGGGGDGGRCCYVHISVWCSVLKLQTYSKYTENTATQTASTDILFSFSNNKRKHFN